MTVRTAAVVLAAGAGRRFGGGKLLAPIDGRPVLQHVLDRLAGTGLDEVVVVLGDDAAAVEAAIDWRTERRVRNPDPSRGLSSSLQVGVAEVGDEVDAALVVLGDQPRLATSVVDALLGQPADPERPFVVPVAPGEGGRNPVRVERVAFPLVAATEGDRGLGPLLADHPELVREVAVDAANPDLDTPADHVAILKAAWADRVRANRAQVDRVREVPDGADFYAPVSSLFRADPRRTDEAALAALRMHVRPGETWLDIGAGAGRYALPIALDLTPSGGSVIAVDPSRSMLDALRSIAAEHAITNVRTIEGRWPGIAGAPSGEPLTGDVSLIAHVGYDIEAIGPFLAAMEAATRRRCLAILMDRQPASLADPCWPPVHGEARIALPALPAFVELLTAMGRAPEVTMVEREPRRFADRAELEGFVQRQLWIERDGPSWARFAAALDERIDTDPDGGIRLRDQPPMAIGLVAWAPGAGAGATATSGGSS